MVSNYINNLIIENPNHKSPKTNQNLSKTRTLNLRDQSIISWTDIPDKNTREKEMTWEKEAREKDTQEKPIKTDTLEFLPILNTLFLEPVTIFFFSFWFIFELFLK